MATTIGTMRVPVFARLDGKEIELGTVELDVEAGEPITNEDGTLHIPLEVKGQDTTD